jgi:Bacterial PH domain
MSANQPSGNPSSGGSPSSSGGSSWSSTPLGAQSGTTPGPAAAGGRKRGRADSTVQTFRSPTALIVWVVWLLFAAANWVDLAVQGRDHISAVAAALLLLATGFAYVTAQRPRIIADKAGITVRNPLRDHRIGWAGVTKVDLADLLRVHCDWAPGSPGKHTKVISSWAVHYSRRRQLSAEAKSRRSSGPRRSSFGVAARGRGLPYGGGMLDGGLTSPPASTAEAEAEKIVRLLSERATAAQAETVWATGTVQIADPNGAHDYGTNGTNPAQDSVAPAAPQATQATPAGTVATMLGPTGWLEPLKSTWSGKALAAILIPALILLIVCLV